MLPINSQYIQNSIGLYTKRGLKHPARLGASSPAITGLQSSSTFQHRIPYRRSIQLRGWSPDTSTQQDNIPTSARGWAGLIEAHRLIPSKNPDSCRFWTDSGMYRNSKNSATFYQVRFWSLWIFVRSICTTAFFVGSLCTTVLYLDQSGHQHQTDRDRRTTVFCFTVW